MPTTKRHFWIKIVLILVLILLFSSLGRTLWHSYQTYRWIAEQEQKVELLEQHVESLEEQVQEATASFRLEERVRNELKYQQNGELLYEIK